MHHACLNTDIRSLPTGFDVQALKVFRAGGAAVSEDKRDIVIKPVARVRSPFQERFGIPRQPGLVPSAISEVRLLAPFGDAAMNPTSGPLTSTLILRKSSS